MVSSTKKYIDTQLAKAWTAINRLLVIWKSDLTDKMKCSFFQASVVLILLYGCTTWMLTKRMEKKLDGNYTRMLPAILNKSWRQHPTKQQLYGHLPPITKTIKVRWTRHAKKKSFDLSGYLFFVFFSNAVLEMGIILHWIKIWKWPPTHRHVFYCKKYICWFQIIIKLELFLKY